jgi:hypothetical protein
VRNSLGNIPQALGRQVAARELSFDGDFCELLALGRR